MGASPSLVLDPSAISLGVEQFSRWRERVSTAVADYARWLAESNLLDTQAENALLNILEKLDSDRLTLAFVAEFSRGKSELINALFFAEFDDRIVPSSAGRTTMCPTEFLWDGRSTPSIRLLPIETRGSDTSLAEYRSQPEQWHIFDFDPTEAASIKEAIAKVCETRVVPIEEAHALGLPARTEDMRSSLNVVEIPRWRHAIVNYPHPLFLQGLRVIDTPGLNAIGAEPELTHSLLPSAHGVVFLVAADAGVSASDMDIWQQHVQPLQTKYAVLNKIDGLWDDLRTEEEIDAQIASQVSSVAAQLQIPMANVFPLSAQKALAARVREDNKLLKRSRIVAFEESITQALLPKRYQIISEQTGKAFGSVVQGLRFQLSEDQRLLSEQVYELQGLRGKNRNSIQQTAMRIRGERQDFEAGLRLMQGLKAAHGSQSKKVLDLVAIDNLKRHVRDARERIRESRLSTSLQSSMRNMIQVARKDLFDAQAEILELHNMMVGMHRAFNTQFGMTLPAPEEFTLQQRLDEVDALAQMFERQFGTVSLLTNEKWVLTRKFFESIALELKKIYLEAIGEVSTWSRSLLSPIEGQLKSQQAQLSSRMETVKQVLEASDTLDERITQLQGEGSGIELQLAQIGQLSASVHGALVTR
jgi:Dynamin family